MGIIMAGEVWKSASMTMRTPFQTMMDKKAMEKMSARIFSVLSVAPLTRLVRVSMHICPP